MKLKPHFGVLVCALILGSCTFKYTPKPDRPMEPIIEFTSQHSLSIVNDQASTEEISVNGMIVNLKAWTDVAIQIAQRELKARGIRFDTGARRSLRLSVMEVRRTTGWVWIESQIDMQVETGGGYSAKYTGKNSSAMVANVQRQADDARCG